MKKMNNKGFSLVELIIVIAIMAILIGVLAPQYLKYVEKSRKSADLDTLDGVYTACTVAATDPDITDGPNVTGSVSWSSSWGKEVLSTVGVSNITSLKFKSASAKGSTCTVTYASDAFTVKAGSLSVTSGAR